METEEKKYIVNIESNVDDYVKQLQAADKAVEDFIQANKELLASQDKSNKDYLKADATLKVLQSERNNAVKNVQTAVKANKAEADSYEKLYRNWQLAQTQLKLMGDAYVINEKGVRVLSQRYVEQSKVVADAKRSLDAFGKGVADNRLNVGNYSEAIEGALDKFKMFPGFVGQAAAKAQQFGTALKSFLPAVKTSNESITTVTGGVQKLGGGLATIPFTTDKAAGGLKKLGTALKALAINPIILILIALVAAFQGLVKIFKTSDEAATKMEARFAQIKAILDVLRQRVLTFASALTNLFKGNWRQAGQDMKNTFTGIGDQMRDATSAAYDYVLAMDAIEDAEKNYVSQSAENRNKIARLEYTAQDRTKSTAERKKALQEAMALGEEEVAAQREFTRKKLDAGISALAGANRVTEQELLAYIKMTDSERELAGQAVRDLYDRNQEKVDGLDELYAQYINLDTQYYEENKRNISRLSGFEEEERNKRVENARKEIDSLFEYWEAQKQAETEYDDWKREKDAKEAQSAVEYIRAQAEAEEEYKEWKKTQEQIDAENRLAILEAQGQSEFAIQREKLDMQYRAEMEAANKTGADRLLIEHKYAEARRKIEEYEAEAKMQILSGFTGSIAQLLGENTAVGRAAAVAQATIDTYLAAQKAYAASAAIPPAPLWGIAAAASAVVSGIATVKKIVSVKSGLPGDSGGGSVPTATAISGSAPAARMTATATRPSVLTQMSQQQLNAQANIPQLTKEDLVDAFSSMPAPRVTVEDINARQAQVQKVEVRATI